MKVIEKILLIIAGILIFIPFFAFIMPEINRAFSYSKEVNNLDNSLFIVQDINNGINFVNQNRNHTYSHQITMLGNLKIDIQENRINYIFLIEKLIIIPKDYPINLRPAEYLLVSYCSYQLNIYFDNNSNEIVVDIF